MGWGSRLPEDRRGNPVPGNPVPGNPVPGNPVLGNPVLGMELQDSPPAARNAGGHLDRWGRVQRAGLAVGPQSQGSRMLVAVGNPRRRAGLWIHRSPGDNLSGTFYLWRENILNNSEWLNN